LKLNFSEAKLDSKEAFIIDLHALINGMDEGTYFNQKKGKLIFIQRASIDKSTS
jgi:hypothetical protein